MNATAPKPRNPNVELTYASWHAHISARTSSLLVFVSRSRTPRVAPAVQGFARTDHLSLSNWLALLSGQRAA